MMDLGTYPLAAVREAFGAEPAACIEANLKSAPNLDQRCDASFHAKLSFPNGGIAEIKGGLRGPNLSLGFPTVTVTHKSVLTTDHEEKLHEDSEVRKIRKVTFVNFMFSPHYHRIDVEDEFVVTKKGSSATIKKFTKKETKKAYTWKEMGKHLPSEPWQSTYGHMLEQFVNKIRGNEGSGIFISADDSVAQMKALDSIYERSGLGLRPTSKYVAEIA